MKEYTTNTLYNLNKTIAKPLLTTTTYPWEILDQIESFIISLGKTLSDNFVETAPHVWIAKTAKVSPTASINPPCIIDDYAEIRHCAYIRGNVIVGKNAVVGNSTEVKNAILFDYVQIPHFNYVGDSILGFHAHLGAGAVTSNVRSDQKNITIKGVKEVLPTNRKKVGAMVGDFVEVGCNSVLCPGVVVGKNTIIYPTSCVRGVVPPHHIFKNSHTIVPMV